MYWDTSLKKASSDWIDSDEFGEWSIFSLGSSGRGDHWLGGGIQGSAELFANTVIPQADHDFLHWEEEDRKREVDILKRVVSKAESSVKKRSEELYKKQEQRDWEQRQELWMKELVGNRNLGRATAEEFEESNPKILLIEDSTHRAMPLAIGTLQASSFNRNMSYHSTDHEVVRYHLEIVKSHKSKETFSVAARDLAKRVDASSVSTPSRAAYATALRLASLILSRPNVSPVEMALATLSLYSQQFDAWIAGKIRHAGPESKGGPRLLAPVYKNTKANTVARFVSLELGAGAENSLWPCLYYCEYCIDQVIGFVELF
jgi:hypothetical protein